MNSFAGAHRRPFYQVGFAIFFIIWQILQNFQGVPAANAMAPQTPATSGAQIVDFRTVTWQGVNYKVKKVVQSGGSYQYFATDMSNNRIMDWDLQRTLVYDSLSEDVYYNTPAQIFLPTADWLGSPGETYTWADYNWVQVNSSLGIPVYTPHYLSFEPTSDSITKKQFILGEFQSDTRIDAYQNAIMAAVLQPLLVDDPNNQDPMTRQKIQEQVQQVEEFAHRAGLIQAAMPSKLPNDWTTVSDILTAMENGQNKQFGLQDSNTVSVLFGILDQAEGVFYKAADLGNETGIFGVVSTIFSAIGYTKEISSGALFAFIYHILSLNGAQQRLGDLIQFVHSLPAGEVDPAFINAADTTATKLQDLMNKDFDAVKASATTPGNLADGAALAAGITTSFLTLAAGVIGVGVASPVIAGIGVAVVVYSAIKPTLAEQYQRNWFLFNAVAAYTLSVFIAQHLPSSPSEVRYYVSLVNLAWAMRAYYYDRIDYLSSNVTAWDPWNYDNGSTSTRPLVINEAGLGRSNTVFYGLKSLYGLWLSPQDRVDDLQYMLALNADDPSMITVGISSLVDGQTFTRGNSIQFQAAASSPAGIQRVDFYVYPSGSPKGAPFCSDADGPDSNNLWGCPSPWQTAYLGGGVYTVEADAVNPFGKSVSQSVSITLLQPSDVVAINASLTPSTLPAGATFTASGTVTENGAPANANMQVEVVGQGTYQTASTQGGSFSVPNIPAPTTAGNYSVKITASTATGAGQTFLPLGVTANPVAGSSLSIRDFTVSDHVEPNHNVHYSAWVYNGGQVPMTFKLVYELWTPTGSKLASYTGPLTTLNPTNAYPSASSLDVEDLGPATSNGGTYTAVARLVDSNNNPLADSDPADNSYSIGVLCSNTTAYNHYQTTEQFTSLGTQLNYSIISSFSVYYISYGANQARLRISRNGTQISDSYYTVGKEYYLASNQVFLYIYSIRNGQCDWLMGEYDNTPSNFMISPTNPIQAKAGEKVYYTIDSNYEVENVDSIDFGTDAATIASWNPDPTTDDTRQHWVMELSIPVNATLRTYTFFQPATIYTTSMGVDYMEKLTIQVSAPDDVGVSTLSFPNGSTAYVGDLVPIQPTIQDPGPYAETQVPVNLAITNASGYSYSAGTTVPSLNSGASANTTFYWDTTGLAAGDYTVSAFTSLASDPNTANNLQSQVIHLIQRPSLAVSGGTDAASYGQNTPLLLFATVTDASSGLAMADATVFAHITGPSVDDTRMLVYNPSTLRYELSMTYLNIGSYQVMISALHSGYISGQMSSPASFSVYNLPPVAWFTQAPTEGAVLSNNTVTFSWTGSDSATPTSALKYYFWEYVPGNGYILQLVSYTTFTKTFADGPHIMRLQAFDGLAKSALVQVDFTVDTVPPKFDHAPQANPQVVSNGSQLVITADASEPVTISPALDVIDSGFSPTQVSVQETNPTNFVYTLTYTLSANNLRPDGFYTIPITLTDAAGNKTEDESLQLRLENRSPDVLWAVPQDTSTNVPVSNPIVVAFSEPMNTASVASALSIQPAAPGSITWNGNTLTLTPSSPLVDGQTYTIQVANTAQDLSGNSLQSAFSASFTTQPIILGTFDKTAPASGATGQPTNPTLTWSSASNANDYEYCIDTTNNDACDGSWIDAGNTHSVSPSGLTPGTTYYWQVLARNGNSLANASEGWWRFTTAPAITLGDFTKSNPGNGSTVQSTTVVLSWLPGANAVTYEFCLDTTQNNPCAGAWTDSNGKTSVTVTGLKPGKLYYWQVRAILGTMSRDASGGWWTFRTNQPPTLLNLYLPLIKK